MVSVRLPRQYSAAARKGNPFLAFARVIYWAGIGLLGFRNFSLAPSLRISDVAFAACTALLILTAPGEAASGAPRWSMALICAAAIYALGGFLTIAAVSRSAGSLVVVVHFAYLTIIWFSLGIWVLRSLTDLLTTVAIWVCSAGLSGIAAIFQLFALKQGVLLPGTPDVQFVGRMTGFTEHPNALGSLCAVALAPALMLVTLRTAGLTQRVILWIAVGGILAGLGLSGSVSGFAAAIAGSIAWATLTRPNWRTPAAGGLVVVAVLAVIYSQQSAAVVSPLDRIQTVIGAVNSDPSAATGLSRVDLIREAWDVVSNSPLIGVGLDQESVGGAFRGGIGVHNILLFAWVGGGIFAFAGMLMTLGIVARSSYHTVVPRHGGLAFQLGCGLAGAYVAFIVYTMSAPVITDGYLWIPVPLILALSAIGHRRSRAERQSSGTS